MHAGLVFFLYQENLNENKCVTESPWRPTSIRNQCMYRHIGIGVNKTFSILVPRNKYKLFEKWFILQENFNPRLEVDGRAFFPEAS